MIVSFSFSVGVSMHPPHEEAIFFGNGGCWTYEKDSVINNRFAEIV
jgi:hypothetical protein